MRVVTSTVPGFVFCSCSDSTAVKTTMTSFFTVLTFQIDFTLFEGKVALDAFGSRLVIVVAAVPETVQAVIDFPCVTLNSAALKYTMTDSLTVLAL